MTDRSRNRPRRRSGVARLTVALVLAVLAPAGTAAAAETDTMRLSPSPLRVAGEERRAFAYDLEPGDVATDAVSLTNRSGTTRRYRLYGADAKTDPATGAVTVSPASVEPSGVGDWIRLETGELTLEPGATEVIGFTLARPAAADAEGLGAIVAEESPEVPEDGGVELVYRLAIVVELGGAETAVDLVAPTLEAPVSLLPSTATVAVDVTNHTLSPARAVVHLEVVGATGRVWAMPPGEVVLAAGETATVEARWTTVPRWGGLLTPRAAVTWEGRTITASGDPLVYPPAWLLVLAILALGLRGLQELRAPQDERAGTGG